MKIHDQKYDLEEIARRLKEARIPGGGPVQFNLYLYEQVGSVLESCVEFRPEIPEADTRSVLHQATTTAVKEGALTADLLRKALQHAEVAYLRKPLRPYVMVTGMGVSFFPALTRVKIGGGTVGFSPAIPRQFDRQPVADLIRQYIAPRRSPKGVGVRVPVRARTHHAAAHFALRRLDLLRGLWNLWLNSETAWRRTSGPRRALNTILLTDVHTVHTPRGDLAAEMFWYDEEATSDVWPFDLRARWTTIRRREQQTRRRLARCPYGDELESLIVRYVRALDVAGNELAFTRLWAVLEHLVGAVGSYKQLVDRVAFMYGDADRPYMWQILQHLRDVRNGMVHDDRQPGAAETYLYQLKMFVERAFNFHLYRAKPFRSLSEAVEFLDLSTDQALLRHRAILYDRGLRYRKSLA